MAKQILQFKISLNDVSPKVWRRIQVPETCTFWDLHCAIQNAVGWSNSHLHGFYLTNNKYGRARPVQVKMPHPEWTEEDDLDESKELLVEWFSGKLKQCIYTYDFGDSWDHTILYEKTLPAATGTKYPVCIAGKNACPPEDCGGIPGYHHLLASVNSPRTKRDRELRVWLGLERGEKYDPTVFNLDDISFENPRTLLKECLQDQEMYG